MSVRRLLSTNCTLCVLQTYARLHIGKNIRAVTSEHFWKMRHRNWSYRSDSKWWQQYTNKQFYKLIHVTHRSSKLASNHMQSTLWTLLQSTIKRCFTQSINLHNKQYPAICLEDTITERIHSSAEKQKTIASIMDILFANMSYLILYNVQFSSWHNFVRCFYVDTRGNVC